MIRKIIRCAEDCECAVAEELIDMPTGIDDGGHHDLKQGVESGHDILGRVGFGEGGEVADVDEHHCHFATLAGEDIVTLFEELRREDGVDVGAEGGLKSLPLSQTRLHAVERRRQRAEVIILNYRQPLAVVASCNSFSSLGEVAKRSQRRRERGGDRVRYPVAQRHCQPDNSAQHRDLAGLTDHDPQQCA